MPFARQQSALQELIGAITEAVQRLERFDAQLEHEVAGWRWEPIVRAYMSLRGVALLNAAILVAELGDLTRFDRPAELMSYLGLVPGEQGGALTQGAARAARWSRRPTSIGPARASAGSSRPARKVCPRTGFKIRSRRGNEAEIFGFPWLSASSRRRLRANRNFETTSRP